MTETDALPLPEPAGADDGPRFIRSLRLTNLLSFGPAGEEIELRSLNVLVGANGSGKTNFVEALAVLAACQSDLSMPFRAGGGFDVWLNKANKAENFTVEAFASGPRPFRVIRHALTLEGTLQRAAVRNEEVWMQSTRSKVVDSPAAYTYDQGEVLVPNRLGEMMVSDLMIRDSQSVLSQLKDQNRYKAIGALQLAYERIRLYRHWIFGPDSSLRKPQASDLPNEWLGEDYGNLFLILNRMEFEPEAKGEFLERLREFLPDVTDYKLQIVGGTILMFLMEGRNAVPATRLSDGTLRWLCLLAILVAPSPPGVIVLEEPELGLHPDMINTLADMLKKAATRHQLVITTHSDILIDALSDVPEAVMVVEKGEEGTTVRRLDAETLKPWLEEYRLGRLWMKGQIGGTRW